jgi:hypothetical protein
MSNDFYALSSNKFTFRGALSALYLSTSCNPATALPNRSSPLFSKCLHIIVFPYRLFFYLRAKLENFLTVARTLPGDQLAMLRLCTSGGYIHNCLSLANILSSIIVGSSVLHHQ